MPTEQFGLDPGLMDLLEQEARKRGITPEALAAELIDRELASRTKPRNARGTVLPFQRKA
ncbi:hypothetical protein QU617_09810 [Pseudomonas guariconensis]|uniref:hypothetical protein n=1 Tax=Pseudomonas guariconensis TaxID=1288410 RepID=UPI0025A9ABD3|nr:hypothetical protein [Pseudomonas guariconensis]MDM9593605.1 hypothetical protein [Pseudomonas guariconensis]MDM9606432.1 hypothetical protein [Pseudomonas guariconensis]MDM9611388.1 hypothetical protein [Pseudomonas guariconensis]